MYIAFVCVNFEIAVCLLCYSPPHRTLKANVWRGEPNKIENKFSKVRLYTGDEEVHSKRRDERHQLVDSPPILYIYAF